VIPETYEVKATLAETEYDLQVLYDGVFVNSTEKYFTGSSGRQKT
jgi:hypothetical protein